MRKFRVGITIGFVVLLVPALLWTSAFAKSNDKDVADGPHIVMIIRHAEKPQEKGDPNLSPRGFERAKALATVLPAHFPHPDFIFASKKSKGSDRPVETITPFSRTVNEPINSTYADEEYQRMADLILHDSKYAGKTIIIAWHHGEIPKLAKALGATDAPDEWPSDTFDRVWEITYDKDGTHFQNLPQQALAGDSDR
jgi:phosphohistidine phosphatase SixA